MSDDAIDLAAFDERADEAARLFHRLDAHLQALANKMTHDGEQDGFIAPADRLRFEQLASAADELWQQAIIASVERRNAYAAMEASLPPASPVFESSEQRDEWRFLVVDEFEDARVRHESAMSELRAMPMRNRIDESTPVEEVLASIAVERTKGRRVELFRQVVEAGADLDRAQSGLKSIEDTDED